MYKNIQKSLCIEKPLRNSYGSGSLKAFSPLRHLVGHENALGGLLYHRPDGLAR